MAFGMAYKDVVYGVKRILIRDNQSIDPELYGMYDRRQLPYTSPYANSYPSSSPSPSLKLHSAQMQLTQPTLLYMTLDVYFNLASHTLQVIEGITHTDTLHVNLTHSKQLTNAVHHYVHALEHTLSHNLLHTHTQKSKSPIDSHIHQLICTQLFDGVLVDNTEYLTKFIQQTIHTLRLRVYNLLKENLLRVKAAYKDHFVYVPAHVRTGTDAKQDGGVITIHHDNIPVLIDYPELVKQVAIAGQHVLLPVNHTHAHMMSSGVYTTSHEGDATASNITSTMNMNSLSHKILEELHQLIQEMLRTTHHTQHPAIHAMQAHVYHQQGLYALQERCIECALVYIENYYNISYSLSVDSGEYGMIIPSLLYANVLSLNKLYSVAERLYAKGIEIALRYQPTYSQEYSQLLGNYGVALYAQQKNMQAIDVLNKFIKMCMDIGCDTEKNVLYNLATEYLANTRGV